MTGFAHIDGATVTFPSGEVVKGQKVARFVCHRDGPKGTYFTVSLPCGACLGNRYPHMRAAKEAAAAMAPLVVDWDSSELYGVFGSEETARKAYDLARMLMQ